MNTRVWPGILLSFTTFAWVSCKRPVDLVESPAETLVELPTIDSNAFDTALQDIVVHEDPTIDGWDSEQLTVLALSHLKQVGALITGSNETSVDALCNPSFEGSSLRPPKLNVVFEDPPITVFRSDPEDAVDSYHGTVGFRDLVRKQAEALGEASDGRSKFKIVRTTLDSNTATTVAHFQASAVTPSQHRQVNASWHCEWSMTGETPKLRRLSVSNYEEVVVTLDQERPSLFADCTQSAFAGIEALPQHLIHGRDHWYGVLEGSIGMEGRGNGIAIGDVNGDELEDLYLCQPAGLPNKLFIRNRDGSLKDHATASGTDWFDSSRGALLIDLDNDGDQDLALAFSGQLIVQSNDGHGRFTVEAKLAAPSSLFSINAIDYDNDGDLDLYACGYGANAQIGPNDIFASPMPYHDANNGGPSILLRNEGDWNFSDVTKDSGLDQHNTRFSLASVWEDYDNDGDPDLYVANDFGRNSLYRNDQGQFTDIAAEAGVEDIGPGMSAAWGDYDNDGWMDLYVSNMFSSAGSRITHDPKFMPGVSALDLSGFRRHARGNSLFRNRGDGTFEDLAIESGTSMGRWAWGSLFLDFNNDGWKDLYVANGFVTADDKDDL